MTAIGYLAVDSDSADSSDSWLISWTPFGEN
jgi:hypothetical protein